MVIKMLSADLPGHVAPKMYFFHVAMSLFPSHSASKSKEMPLKELQKDCREMEVWGLHQKKPGGEKFQRGKPIVSLLLVLGEIRQNPSGIFQTTWDESSRLKLDGQRGLVVGNITSVLQRFGIFLGSNSTTPEGIYLGLSPLPGCNRGK